MIEIDKNRAIKAFSNNYLGEVGSGWLQNYISNLKELGYDVVVK
jgi:hypothetical protein